MKKTIAILLSLVVICSIISIISNQDTTTDDESREETQPQQEPTSQETINADIADTAVKISSDEYFDIISNAIKKYVEPAGYTITSISTIGSPYYAVDCKTTNVDITNFKAEVLKISEDIYNDILVYEYKMPNIFVASHEIISLNFLGIEKGEIICGLTVQFDLTDIDRSKPFLENLKTPMTP